MERLKSTTTHPGHVAFLWGRAGTCKSVVGTPPLWYLVRESNVPAHILARSSVNLSIDKHVWFLEPLNGVCNSYPTPLKKKSITQFMLKKNMSLNFKIVVCTLSGFNGDFSALTWCHFKSREDAKLTMLILQKINRTIYFKKWPNILFTNYIIIKIIENQV